MSRKASTPEKLSPTLENYLEIIFQEEYKEGVARTGTIAQKAGVSASTVTSALKTLEKLGYVSYLPYKFIRLTEKGHGTASEIIHKHNVLLEFFHSILDIEKEKAENMACEIEHIIDDETFTQLRKFVFHMLKDVQSMDRWKNHPITAQKTSEKHA